MRVVERQMLKAIHLRKDWSSGNTKVSVTYFMHGDRPIDRVNVFLHDHLIATVNQDTVEVCDCGYQTNTTKSRLNVILRDLCQASIYQKKFIWYGSALEESDWVIEKGSRHVFVRV